MTEPERFDNPLPPDLAEVERLLHEPAAPPPPELLSRIYASRDLGVVVDRMLLAEEEFAQRTRRRRFVISLASAAVLMIGAFGVWRVTGPHAQRERPTTTAAGARAEGASPSIATEVSRLLQPWPSIARAQAPARGELVRPLGAPLEPGARARVSPSRRVYSQLRRTSGGREIGRAQVDVRLDSMTYRGARRWLLTTRIDDGDSVVQMDSLMLDAKTLLPKQRRVRADGRHWYYRFTPRQVEATDTLPGVFFQKEFERRSSLWAAPQPADRGFWYAIKEVDPKTTLVLSEAHLALLLRTWPLSVGMEMPISFVNSSRHLFGSTTSLQLRITRVDTLAHESVATPCFRVELDYGARPDLWWVRVSDGELIRASRLTPSSAVSEVTWLTSVKPLRP